jgi:CRISPR-associated protein Cas2
VDSFIVAYDISDPKRLRKVARICEDHGIRYQYSVFICRLNATSYGKLRARLYEVLNLTEDQVLFVPLCGKCIDKIDTLGRPSEPPASRDVVIVT